MNIGGLNPLSMIDFPGTPSAVVFTNGCNLSCPYCHNPLLAKGISPQIPEQEVKEFLKSRVGKLQGVVISGGEPWCQGDSLVDFCAFCRKLGYRVKVDTNGTLPYSVFGALKWLGGVTDWAVDLKINDIFETSTFNDLFDALCWNKGHVEFRVTCCYPMITPDGLKNILDLMDFRYSREHEGDFFFPIYLQHCNVTPEILNPEFFESGKGNPWTQEEIYNFVEKYGKRYNVKAR